MISILFSTVTLVILSKIRTTGGALGGERRYSGRVEGREGGNIVESTH
jgi:hypothetical protein